MKCNACDATFSAETFEGWVEQMKPHYAAMHGDVMASKAHLSDAEKMKVMQDWMARANEQFDAITEAAQ